MKVWLNLAVLPSRRERYALTWCVPVAVLGLVGVALLCTSAVRGVREYRQARDERFRLQSREESLIKTERQLRAELDHPRFRELFRETQFVNALIEKKRISLTALAKRVTRLLPPSVHLTGLAMSQAEGDPVVRVMVVGSNEVAIENFVTHLEDAPDFRDVAIVNQSIEETGSAAGRVTVTCTARYLGGQEG